MLYADVTKPNTSYNRNKKKRNKIVIFGDSIPRAIRRAEFNNYLKGSAMFKCFRGATSDELVDLIKPTLNKMLFNSAVIHIGIN